MELQKKRIVLVGASSGIGRSLALELGRSGAHVIAMARRKAALDTLVSEIRGQGGSAEAIEVDTSDRLLVRTAHDAAQKGGPIDGLIYNAGASHATRWDNFTADETKRVFLTNFYGFLYWAELVLPALRARGSGFMAATTALCAYRGIPGAAEYAASKAALSQFLEGMRLDNEAHGVQVFQLMPGIVTTPMWHLNNMSSALEVSADDAAKIIVKAFRKGQTRVEFGAGMSRMMRIARNLPDGMYSRIFRSSFSIPRANMERMLGKLPPFQCPTHRNTLGFDGYASLVCPDCDHRVTMVKGRMDILDGTGEADTQVNHKVKFAYRFYSMVYPLVALFALWFVWLGSLRTQLQFYRARVREAAARQRPFLDVATGDGSLTQLVLRKLRERPDFISVDISRDMLLKAATKFRSYPGKLFYICDIGKVSIKERSFSDILCFGGLHVFSDPLGALVNLRRLLTDDGVVSGSYLLRPGTPVRDGLADWFVDKGLLSTSFTPNEIDRLFQDAGFKYVRREMSGRLLLFSLAKDEASATA